MPRNPMPMNGVDTPTLFATLNAVKEQPAAAKFQFRARNKWVSGTHSRTTIDSFFGVGQEGAHKQAFEYDADHLTELVGTDMGPTPVEFLLHALASCLTAGMGNISAARGIELDSIESKVEGNIDLNGILGLNDEVRNGYENIKISFKVKGKGSEEQLQALVAQSTARSAVYDVLTNGVPVTVETEVESTAVAA